MPLRGVRLFSFRSRRCVAAALLLVAAVAASGAAAVPLRLVNLHPLHLLYGVPRSFGAGVMRPGAVEAVASLDAASQFSRGSAGIPRQPEDDATYREDFPGWAPPGAERILIDVETYRQALALRLGLRERWELLVEVAALAHVGGAFDRYVADWHRAFGLIPGGRQHVPHNRMALYYARDAGRGGVHVDLEGSTAALGDASLGVGYALPGSPLGNDGVAVRAALKLPAGNAGLLTGSGGLAAAVWAETSGALPGAPMGRPWAYAATLGALAAEAPRGLPKPGRDWLVFGRLGVTWRPLPRLDLTAQIDAHSSPYSASELPHLAHAAVMYGVGGALRLGEHFSLEVAVTEDMGDVFRSAPDIGLHVALRWRPPAARAIALAPSV
ncbi:MAG: DUF3187 family protein [Candidatus Tectomicrobia bacterium]|nr:DUF3187 family protein [Candidatus Tectomicrobia bacterium]